MYVGCNLLGPLGLVFILLGYLCPFVTFDDYFMNSSTDITDVCDLFWVSRSKISVSGSCVHAFPFLFLPCTVVLVTVICVGYQSSRFDVQTLVRVMQYTISEVAAMLRDQAYPPLCMFVIMVVLCGIFSSRNVYTYMRIETYYPCLLY